MIIFPILKCTRILQHGSSSKWYFKGTSMTICRIDVLQRNDNIYLQLLIYFILRFFLSEVSSKINCFVPGKLKNNLDQWGGIRYASLTPMGVLMLIPRRCERYWYGMYTSSMCQGINVILYVHKKHLYSKYEYI